MNATSYANKAITKLQKGIEETYSQARVEIEQKIDDFTKKSKVIGEIHQQQVKSGEWTQQMYDEWVAGQVFQGNQWNAKRDEIINVISNANQISTDYINKQSLDVFAYSGNFQAYQMEASQEVNFGFNLYDKKSVVEMVKSNPDTLPKWKIDEVKDYTWNKKKLNNAINQGIIQGESLSDISKRVANSLSISNGNLMKTFAKTAMTCAQNAGCNERLIEANENDIEVVKEWVSTLDMRTRHSHKMMDGETIPVPKDKWHPTKFSNGLRYPGDPQGPAIEVYNCRCILVGDILGYPEKYERRDNINGQLIKGMTYKEWYKAKTGKEITVKVAKQTTAKVSLEKTLQNAKDELHKLQDKVSNEDVVSKAQQDYVDSLPSPFSKDAYSAERKKNALWASSKKEADEALRPQAGEVWRNATQLERDALYNYTRSYSKFNEPLRGWEYDQSDYDTGFGFKGVGNVDLNAGGTGAQLNIMTSLINKSQLDHDQWFQRGCNYGGMDNFFQCDIDLLMFESQAKLENELLGKIVTEHAFMSCGSSKGTGLNTEGGILLNIYAPKGTKAVYTEPFSAFGRGDKRNWDGISKQDSLGDELETILQQGTDFRITKVERVYIDDDDSMLYVDLEVIAQETSKQQLWKG